MEQADHRHRRLLRSRRERPRKGSAAEERNELAASQFIELHLALPAQARSQDIALAKLSLEVTGRFNDLFAAASRCVGQVVTASAWRHSTSASRFQPLNFLDSVVRTSRQARIQ